VVLKKGNEMEKAYDIKALAEKLKAKGMPEVEGLAKAAVDSVFEWAQESAAMSPTPIDDMVASFLPAFKRLVDSKLEEIS